MAGRGKLGHEGGWGTDSGAALQSVASPPMLKKRGGREEEKANIAINHATAAFGINADYSIARGIIDVVKGGNGGPAWRGKKERKHLLSRMAAAIVDCSPIIRGWDGTTTMEEDENTR